MGAGAGLLFDAVHLGDDASGGPLEFVGRHRGGPATAQGGAQGPQLGIEPVHRPGQHDETEDDRAGRREERETHDATLPTRS